MSARKPPRAVPAAAGTGVLVALLLVALGVVAVRELAIARGWAGGSSWVDPLVDSVDGLQVSDGLTVVAVVIGIVGLLVIWTAVKPGRLTHLRAAAPGDGAPDDAPVDADVWLSRSAMAALAGAVADRQRGVVSVEAEPGRRRVELEVVARDDAAGVERSITQALDQELAGLTRLRLDVHVREVSR